MARHTENESYLRDGAVMIYVRNDIAKPIWQCRVKFPDQPYIRRSLKTRNRGAKKVKFSEKKNFDRIFLKTEKTQRI